MMNKQTRHISNPNHQRATAVVPSPPNQRLSKQTSVFLSLAGAWFAVFAVGLLPSPLTPVHVSSSETARNIS